MVTNADIHFFFAVIRVHHSHMFFFFVQIIFFFGKYCKFCSPKYLYPEYCVIIRELTWFCNDTVLIKFIHDSRILCLLCEFVQPPDRLFTLHRDVYGTQTQDRNGSLNGNILQNCCHNLSQIVLGVAVWTMFLAIGLTNIYIILNAVCGSVCVCVMAQIERQQARGEQEQRIVSSRKCDRDPNNKCDSFVYIHKENNAEISEYNE